MIEHRDTFLQTVATQIGRISPNLQKPERAWKHSPQNKILKDASIEDLVEIFVEQCSNIHTTVKISTIKDLLNTLQNVIDSYCATSVIYSKDSRFTSLNLLSVIMKFDEYEWDASKTTQNIEKAEKADVGIIFSELTLAESGTVVIQTSPNVGRSLSFLPENSIVIIPKSSIVPRMTQAAQYLRNQVHISSCINFITGPSNSADIEMNLVVGVHGPVKMTYIIVDDL